MSKNCLLPARSASLRCRITALRCSGVGGSRVASLGGRGEALPGCGIAAALRRGALGGLRRLGLLSRGPRVEVTDDLQGVGRLLGEVEALTVGLPDIELHEVGGPRLAGPGLTDEDVHVDRHHARLAVRPDIEARVLVIGDEATAHPLLHCVLKSIEVTVTSQPKKDVKLALEVLNAPANAPRVVLTPAQATIYGPAEQLNTITKNSIVIGTLDYSKLTNKKYVIPYDISLSQTLKDCHVIVETDDSVTATLDLSSYKAKTITVDITTKVDSSKYTAEISSATSVKLTVYAPANVISSLNAKSLTAVVDITQAEEQLDDEKTVSITVPLTITFGEKFKTCWAAETDPINVNVSPKTK